LDNDSQKVWILFVEHTICRWQEYVNARPKIAGCLICLVSPLLVLRKTKGVCSSTTRTKHPSKTAKSRRPRPRAHQNMQQHAWSIPLNYAMKRLQLGSRLAGPGASLHKALHEYQRSHRSFGRTANCTPPPLTPISSRVKPPLRDPFRLTP
jgi:hypothetical protein